MAADLVDLKNWIPGQLWGTVRSNQIDIAKVSKGLSIGGISEVGVKMKLNTGG